MRLITFFDCEGVIHNEVLPHGQTVNKKYYSKVMKRLREAVMRQRPDLWRRKEMVAPAHSSLLTRNFFTKHEKILVPQPLYSPDLASADFFLFNKLQIRTGRMTI
jgi:hypothetical protein